MTISCGSHRHILLVVELSQQLCYSAVKMVSKLPAPFYRFFLQAGHADPLDGTIHNYLDLISTQRIQTHSSHRHNITSPFQTLAQSPDHLPTPHLHHHNPNTDARPTLPLLQQDWLIPNPILLSTHPFTSYTSPSNTHFTHSTNSSHPKHHTYH